MSCEPQTFELQRVDSGRDRGNIIMVNFSTKRGRRTEGTAKTRGGGISNKKYLIYSTTGILFQKQPCRTDADQGRMQDFGKGGPTLENLKISLKRSSLPKRGGPPPENLQKYF